VDLSLYLDFRPAPGATPGPAHYEEMFALVREAERLGFHGVWTTEQHGVDDGYLPTQLPVLAALARETETVRLGTGVILLPLTHPRRVLEEACVVDVLSHGRLVLGLGAGNYPNEFRLFDVDLGRRRRLMDEGVAFIREGLAGRPLPDGSPVAVPPVQRPVPLVLGGLVAPAVDRAARLGDGHFAYAYVDPEEQLPRLWEELLAPALARHGRGLAEFRLIFSTVIWASDNVEREWHDVVGPAFAYQQARYAEWEADVPTAGGYADTADLDELRSRMLVGRPDEIADRLLALASGFPFDEVVLWPRLPGVPHTLAREHLACLAEGVIPALRAAGART
jgi:alkanesulfonate monooxygenase SsuD/methylene tetrahydromethanopterin reductase-like flavin-dependent oxidoreductase (luciferase family)